MLQVEPSVPLPLTSVARFVALALPRRPTGRKLSRRGRDGFSLRSEELDVGTHTVTWDRRSASGTRVASGVYFARMQTGAEERIERLIVVHP